MGDTINFTGAVLKSFSRTHKGGVASFSANLTKTVCDAMGWGGISNGQSSAKFEGSLEATAVVLAPKQAELKKHKVDFYAKSVGSFEAIRYELEGHKGKGHRYELHFKIGFAAENACRQLEQYMLTIGEGKSVLTVSYVKQTEMGLVTDDQASLEDED